MKPRVWGWTDSLQQQLNIQVVNSVFWGRMKQVSTLLSKPAALYRTLPGARVHLVASSPWSASIYCRNVPFWSQAPCTCVYPVNPRSAEWSLDDGRMMHWPMTASAADGRLTLQKNPVRQAPQRAKWYTNNAQKHPSKSAHSVATKTMCYIIKTQK